MPDRAVAVLVGAPGAGKTAVGSVLASVLGTDFVDVDHRIERATHQSIPQIFADHGEQHFRTLELEHTVAAISDPVVVALGGGAVTNPAVREALAGHRVIWLRVGVEQALRRIGSGTTRPLLAGDVATRWRELVTAREHLYRQVATHQLDTDGLSVPQAAAALAELLSADRQPTTDGSRP